MYNCVRLPCCIIKKGGAYGVTLIPPLGGRLTCFHPSADLQEVRVIPIGLQVGQMVKAFRKVPFNLITQCFEDSRLDFSDIRDSGTLC